MEETGKEGSCGVGFRVGFTGGAILVEIRKTFDHCRVFTLERGIRMIGSGGGGGGGGCREMIIFFHR